MNIVLPLNKKVIVEPEAKETKTSGGIIIPDTANQKAPTKGTVIAIAEDSDIKLRLSVGDIVLFPKYAGTEIAFKNDPGRILMIMKDEDILAKVEYREGK